MQEAFGYSFQHDLGQTNSNVKYYLVCGLGRRFSTEVCDSCVDQ